jgi:hypothetical protein
MSFSASRVHTAATMALVDGIAGMMFFGDALRQLVRHTLQQSPDRGSGTSANAWCQHEVCRDTLHMKLSGLTSVRAPDMPMASLKVGG